jgi:hypothetical protein
MFILQNLLLTLPLLLFKIHQLNKALHHRSPPHVNSPKSPPHTTPLFKIHQLNKLFIIVLFHMFILQSLVLTLPILFKIHQML